MFLLRKGDKDALELRIRLSTATVALPTVHLLVCSHPVDKPDVQCFSLNATLSLTLHRWILHSLLATNKDIRSIPVSCT